MNRAHLIAALVLVAMATQAACRSDDGATTTAPQPASRARVTSSLAEGIELTKPIHWGARVTGVPPATVVAVRFFVDGEVQGVDRKPPWRFTGADNRLVPSALGSGSHTFGVDAVLRDGSRLTTASTATVAEKEHRR